MFIGFIISLLSFILYLNIEDKNTGNLLLERISMLFWIGFGAIGFSLILVYII